jgi:four helix bundle protein
MNHEKLICYQKALQLAKNLHNEYQSFGLGYAYIKDQTKRAISSVCLNLCEGNAKRSLKDRRRFFDIAKGSIAEVSACLDLMEAFGLISSSTHQQYKSEAVEVIKMLYGLR